MRDKKLSPISTNVPSIHASRILAPDGMPAGLVTEVTEKTELREVDARPRIDKGQATMKILAKVAKTAALEMIREEVLLYQGLIQDAKGNDEKLQLIDRLAALKLRAAGIVLAGMSEGRRSSGRQGKS